MDPWQVAEARLHGADAVLLMLSVLDDAGEGLAAAARGVGIETLTEVHSRRELERAVALGARSSASTTATWGPFASIWTSLASLAPLVPRDRC